MPRWPDAAVKGIASLNERYPSGNFLLFHRPREWSEGGAVLDRARAKARQDRRPECFPDGPRNAGDSAYGTICRAPIRYVITLDSDTRCRPVPARRMVETIAHPLNRGADRSGHRRRASAATPSSSRASHRAARRDGHAIHARLRGYLRDRSLLPLRLRRAAGFFRRRHLPRQGDLRCRRLRRRCWATASRPKLCSVTI